MIMGAMPRHPVSAVLTWRLDCLVADAAHRKLDPSTSTSGRERDFHPVASGRFETGAAPLDGGDSLPLHLRRRNDCQGAPLLLLATLILAACLEVPLLGVLRAGLPSGATRSHQEPSGAIEVAIRGRVPTTPTTPCLSLPHPISPPIFGPHPPSLPSLALGRVPHPSSACHTPSRRSSHWALSSHPAPTSPRAGTASMLSSSSLLSSA